MTTVIMLYLCYCFSSLLKAFETSSFVTFVMKFEREMEMLVEVSGKVVEGQGHAWGNMQGHPPKVNAFGKIVEIGLLLGFQFLK